MPTASSAPKLTATQTKLAERHAARRTAVLRSARKIAKQSERPVPDAVLVTDVCDIRYLTGLEEGSSSMLFTQSWAMLVTNAMFADVARDQAPGVEVLVLERGQTADQALKAAIRGHGIRRVALQADKLTLQRSRAIDEHFPKSRRVELSGITLDARGVKDDQEVRITRKAVKIAEQAMTSLIEGGAKSVIGKTEKQIAALLEYTMRDLGADRQGFGHNGIIVAAGTHAASGHHVPTDRKVKQGDILLIDWGAELDGYRSDMTRTYHIGEPKPFIAEAHELVHNAYKASVAAIKPNVKCNTVDAAARDLIEDAGMGQLFFHSTGHGLGLEIHEHPFVAAGPRGDTRLKTGMLITIEPGVYDPSWGGIRLEDDFLVTAKGSRNLCSLPMDVQSSVLT